MKRLFTLALVGMLTVSLSGVAAAAHLVIEVSGPDEVIVGEELEISAGVRAVSDGAPVAGADVVFFGDSFFAGVAGEIQLGSAITNNIGVATFTMSFSVRGIHRVRVEVRDGPETQEAALIIGVDNGPQIVASEAGVDIPGLGSWLVTLVIASVWVVMILAARWMVRVSRPGRGEGDDEPGGQDEDGDEPQPAVRRRRRFNVAVTATGAMIFLALGLVTVLIRSPDTHHNLDPEGYSRSPVAYLDAAYVYPGLGSVDGDALSGNAIQDGRSLFLKLGCAGCHGLDAQGASAARSPAFATRQWLGTVIRTGLPGGMPAYALSDLSEEEIDTMHAFLLNARDELAHEVPVAPVPATTTTLGGGGSEETAPSFGEVLQILQPNCLACHGAAGGWSAADYASVVGSGDNGPAVIPGNAEDSVLARKLLGTQELGTIMPPGGGLADSEIQLIVDWITGGALP